MKSNRFVYSGFSVSSQLAVREGGQVNVVIVFKGAFIPDITISAPLEGFATKICGSGLSDKLIGVGVGFAEIGTCLKTNNEITTKLHIPKTHTFSKAALIFKLFIIVVQRKHGG
jgi:hypothetical protein